MADQQEPVSRKIGPYYLGKDIGKGHYGIVKVASHEITLEAVAVKIISKARLKMPAHVKNLRSEIRHLKLFIKHPHIIKLYDVLFTPTDIFLIMEYAHGGTLHHYMRDRDWRIPKRDARRFFQQIISAVDFCHIHNVMHRDLKPSNILLGSDNKIKIADFGLSIELEDGKHVTTYCGTKTYMSPEISAKMDYIGPEGDVWSCGIILYMMLLCIQPEDITIHKLFKNVEKRKFPIPKNVNKHLGRLLALMLDKEGRTRGTIKAIRDNIWFQKDLDPGLFPSPAQQASFIVHPEIVHKICKVFKTPEVEVRRALLDGGPDNDFQKAYKILQEGQQWKEAYMRDTLHPAIENTRNNQQKTEKWGVGIQIVNGLAQDVMIELFHVLKNLNFEWSHINYWEVVVRKRYRDTARYNVMSIQLYQVNFKHLLDFRSLGFQFPATSTPPETGSSSGSTIVHGVSGMVKLPPNVCADPCKPSHSLESISSDSSSGTIGRSDSVSLYSTDSCVDTHSPEDLRRHEVMEFFEMCSTIFQNLRLRIIPVTYQVEKFSVC